MLFRSILWVPISASSYMETEIAKYQAAWAPDRPLNSLLPAEQDAALVDICQKIDDAITLDGLVARCAAWRRGRDQSGPRVISQRLANDQAVGFSRTWKISSAEKTCSGNPVVLDAPNAGHFMDAQRMVESDTSAANQNAFPRNHGAIRRVAHDRRGRRTQDSNSPESR